MEVLRDGLVHLAEHKSSLDAKAAAQVAQVAVEWVSSGKRTELDANAAKGMLLVLETEEPASPVTLALGLFVHGDQYAPPTGHAGVPLSKQQLLDTLRLHSVEEGGIFVHDEPRTFERLERALDEQEARGCGTYRPAFEIRDGRVVAVFGTIVGAPIDSKHWRFKSRS